MLEGLGQRSLLKVLGAVARVAAGGQDAALSAEASRAIGQLAGLLLGDRQVPPEPAPPTPCDPEGLAAAVPSPAERGQVLELLGVAALIDGVLDPVRIGEVRRFAEACQVEEQWLELLSASTGPRLGSVLEAMSDANLRSISHGRVELSEIEDVNAWLLPYDAAPDGELTERYRALAGLAPGTLGHEFWSFYQRHQFGFPGRAGAANELFTTPHDCTHLLSGYDTTPEGELLVSSFTARMHPVFAMEGHILPVIYSWHLGIELNKLAGSYRGAFDLAKYWVASERGQRCRRDTFGDEFSFWEEIETPLETLERAFEVPVLEPRFAAHSTAVAGVDYTPIA